MMVVNSKVWASAAAMALAATLAGCGGGGGGGDGGNAGGAQPAPVTPPQAALPPGGLYVGFYAEDAAANPEDPTLGAFQMRLPEGNADYAGSMFFTYVGCQSSNVGTTAGTKADTAIRGSIAGTVDGLALRGSYSGSYDAAVQRYTGTYALEGGKQYRDLRPCIEYYIAPNGTFEMYPVGVAQPASFQVQVSGRSLQWGSLGGASQTLAYVLDPSATASNANPVLWQGLVFGTQTQVTLPDSVTLTRGREYVAAVAVGSATLQRLGFGSVRFVAP